MKFAVSGHTYDFQFDPSKYRGDALEVVEERLGQPVLRWVRRLSELASLEPYLMLDELYARDVIAMVFLHRSLTERSLTWDQVSSAIEPWSITPAVDEPAPAQAAVDADELADRLLARLEKRKTTPEPTT